MSETKPKQCICGKYPEIEKKVGHYGGGRYKAGDRSEWWEARCRGCYRRAGNQPSRQAVIDAWNARVLKDRARRDAKDKLAYDLERASGSWRYHSTTNVDRALARLLKDVQEIKEQVTRLADAAKSEDE